MTARLDFPSPHELASVTHRVVQFSEIPTQNLLLHLAGEQFQRVLPAWAKDFFEAEEQSGGILGATLKAYANANMNALKAAQLLQVHPNTIYSRMQKILDISGLEPKNYHSLTELLIVINSRPNTNELH